MMSVNCQYLQEKTLSWGCLSLTPNGFLLLWLSSTVPACARPYSVHPSLALILSFPFWPMLWTFTLSNHLQTLLMGFPCHPSAQQLHPPFHPSFFLPLLPSTITLSLLPPICTVTTVRRAQEPRMTPSFGATWLGISSP